MGRGTSGVGPEADIQEALILAFGVVPSSTLVGHTEILLKGQERTESRLLWKDGVTVIFKPKKSFAEQIWVIVDRYQYHT